MTISKEQIEVALCGMEVIEKSKMTTYSGYETWCRENWTTIRTVLQERLDMMTNLTIEENVLKKSENFNNTEALEALEDYKQLSIKIAGLWGNDFSNEEKLQGLSTEALLLLRKHGEFNDKT